jgi:hypothetical protein
MQVARGALVLLISAAFVCACIIGCGSTSSTQESTWREEVNSSLASLDESAVYHYHLKLERWVSVSGQSIYGDESGEGSYLDHDLSIDILRNSPAGEENLVVSSWQGELYIRENGLWRAIDSEELPSPLYDPRTFLDLVRTYGEISLEGEEERGGLDCRRYLLLLSGDLAREALSSGAWSYYPQLRYELRCRIWACDPSLPPVSVELEVVGFDPEESLQRYRLLATLNLYDIDSPNVQLIIPLVTGEE